MKMGSKRDDDEKAVEELLCEAMDMVILEQAAALNNSPASSQSLPSHLETRFQLLKASTTQTHASFPDKTCKTHLPHSSKKVEQKLRRYEKWEILENISPPTPKSRRGRFWCWGRESREKRERNSEQVFRKMFEKAKKDELKICGEAEKVVKLVNYASAQMEINN